MLADSTKWRKLKQKDALQLLVRHPLSGADEARTRDPRRDRPDTRL